MSTDLIRLRVPAATKGRWIRASRAEGKRITDWIIEHVEASMRTQVKIPAGLDFAALKIARSPSGSVSFDVDTVAQIEDASGLPHGYFMSQPEDVLADLITRWYAAHRAAGGDADPVAEDLIAEVHAEDAAGQATSHKPGRA